MENVYKVEQTLTDEFIEESSARLLDEVNKSKLRLALVKFRQGSGYSLFYNPGLVEKVWENVDRSSEKDVLSFVNVLIEVIGSNWDYDINEKDKPFSLGIQKVVRYNLKEVCKKLKINKLKKYSIITELLTKEVSSDFEVKLFHTYEDLKYYYARGSCSGGSCMGSSFTHLDYHPCIAYASDAKDVVDSGALVAGNATSSFRLAVLFTGDEPLARCMIDIDAKTRGKAQGVRASELVKHLTGYTDRGLSGYINIVQNRCDGYIIPYIDGCLEVDKENGELHTGSLSTSNTGGISNETVYSEWFDEHIEEDDAVWSGSFRDWFAANRAVEVQGRGWYPEEHDDIVCIDGEYYHKEDCVYLECVDEWFHEDDVEEALIDYIKEKLEHQSFSGLLEIAENL